MSAEDIKVYEIPEPAVIEPKFNSQGKVVFSAPVGTPDIESDLLISVGIWLLENPTGGKVKSIEFHEDTWYLNLYLDFE